MAAEKTEESAEKHKQVLVRLPEEVWAAVQQIHEEAVRGRVGLRISVNSVLTRLIMVGVAHKAEF